MCHIYFIAVIKSYNSGRCLDGPAEVQILDHRSVRVMGDMMIECLAVD